MEVIHYSENAQKAYKNLYLVCDSDENPIENIDQCHLRVAKFHADDVAEEKVFKNMLDDQIFRINTPAMTNAGVKMSPILCACFIIGLEDDMDSIINMWSSAARIYEGGGGCGIPITNLREQNSWISSGGFASGPLSYLHVIQSISDQVKSGGRARRAANLVSYDYNHPDALKITTCKNDKKSFTAMNLSMLVDNRFMEAVTFGNEQAIPEKSPKRGYTGEPVDIQKLWNTVIEQAWNGGDPGLLFYDRINQDNPTPSLGDIKTTNPCGEVPEMPWTACVLGHWNLNKFLYHDYRVNGLMIDWNKFDDYIYWGVLFLNKIIDKTAQPNDKFHEMMQRLRPIGMGFMGLADVLFKLRIPYGSEEAQQFVDNLQEFLTRRAFEWSKYLAENDICSSVDIPREDEKHFFEYLEKFGVKPTTTISNTQVTCIAPTGCQSGDTLITTQEGLLTLNELNPDFESKKQWQDLKVEIPTYSNIAETNQFFNNGKSTYFEIVGEYGTQYKITPEHKFQVYDFKNEKIIWKQAIELQKEDYFIKSFNDYPKIQNLVSLDNSVNPNFPDKLTKELAFMLGFYMGDGHALNSNNYQDAWRLDFTIGIEFKNKVTHFLRNIFKKYFQLESGEYSHGENGIRFSLYNKNLINWFINNGFAKFNGTHNSFIPKKVRQSPRKVCFAFISGLIASDGHLRTDRPQAYFNTTSKTLGYQYHNLMWALGIPTKIEKESIPNKELWICDHFAHQNYARYRIYPINQSYGQQFLNQLNLMNTKHKARAEELLQREIQVNYNDYIPINKTEMPDLKYLKSNTKIEKTHLFNRFSAIAKGFSQHRFIKNEWMLEKVETTKFKKKKIDTFDLSVPNLHSYISNNTVSHNSTSISADCSYGFEPHMALVWSKKLSDSDDVMHFFDQEFKNECNNRDIPLTEHLVNEIKKNKGSIKGINDFPKDMQEVFVTAHDLNWKDRIDMQAAAQQYITMSISSTVNLPNSATKEDVANVYQYAWKQGLKGITIFRDGCLDSQPVNFGASESTTKETPKEPQQTKRERPKALKGETHKLKTGSGTLYLTINELEGNPFEVFATVGNSGRSMAAKAEAIGRLTSLALRTGVPIEEIVRQLEGIGGDYQIFQEGMLVKSIPDGVAHILKRYLNDNWNGNSVKNANEEVHNQKIPGVDVDTNKICPSCGQPTLRMDTSCRGGECTNPDCFYSNCS